MVRIKEGRKKGRKVRRKDQKGMEQMENDGDGGEDRKKKEILFMEWNM